LLKNLTKILTYLEPKEKKEYELEIPPGFLRGCDRLNRAELTFNFSGKAKKEIQKLSPSFTTILDEVAVVKDSISIIKSGVVTFEEPDVIYNARPKRRYIVLDEAKKLN